MTPETTATVEELYTFPAIATRLGMTLHEAKRLVYRSSLPRRMERNGQHGYRRVFTTSDLIELSALRVQAVTALGHRNPGRPRA